MSCHRCRQLGHLVADCPNPCSRCKRSPGTCRGGKDCETFLKRKAEQANLDRVAGSALGQVLSKTAKRKQKKKQKMSEQSTSRLLAVINARRVKAAAAGDGATVINDPAAAPGTSAPIVLEDDDDDDTATNPATQSTFLESPSIGNRVRNQGRKGRGQINLFK